MKTYTLKLKTTSTTNYNLYDGTTLVSDSDLGTLFGSAGEAYFTFDFNSLTPTNLTSLTILNSQDTAVITNTGLSGIAENKNFKGTWSASATAFDSFALLSGVAMDEAQLSKLVGIAKDGKIKTLTTEDYDVPAATPTAIYYPSLAPGIYQIKSSVVRFSGYSSVSNPFYLYENDMLFKNSNSIFYYSQTNGLHVRNSETPGDYGSLWPAVDNLTSSAAARPLSAKQGRVLNDKIEGRIITGSGAPTTSTVGTVGKLYEDTTNGKLYQCTSVSGGTYTWEELGGGGGPTVVQTTGTSTTDVMSQDAVTGMVFNNNNRRRIIIGEGANAGSTSSGTGVIIGGGSYVSYSSGFANNVVIGDYCGVSRGGNNVVIGNNTLSNSGSGNIVIGHNAKTGAQYEVVIGGRAFDQGGNHANGSISLGAFSAAHSVGEMNIGSSDTTYGYNNSNYRLLSGLYDGQSAHDAATVAQGNTLSTTAPTTTTEGVLGQLYTDTANMHTYQCTAIDTTDPDNPSYTWTQRW